MFTFTLTSQNGERVFRMRTRGARPGAFSRREFIENVFPLKNSANLASEKRLRIITCSLW